MPVVIRSKRERVSAPADDDVVLRLAECHARIRRFLEEAAALARSRAEDEGRAASAAAVHRYFGVALPLHADDEDRSIAPALEPGASALVHRLAREHDEIVAALQTLAGDWARWAAGEPDAASAAHVDVLRALTTSLLGHLALEEAELFPAIARLPAPQRQRIVAEMIARRSSVPAA